MIVRSKTHIQSPRGFDPFDAPLFYSYVDFHTLTYTRRCTINDRKMIAIANLQIHIYENIPPHHSLDITRKKYFLM